MISLLKYVYDRVANSWYNEANSKEELERKLKLAQEEYLKCFKNNDELCSREISSKKDSKTLNLNGKDDNFLGYEDNNCFTKVGVITSLNENFGVIDKFIRFDNAVAKNVLSRLRRGTKVSYLAYYKDETKGCIKVVKIKDVVEDFWEDEYNQDENEVKEKSKLDDDLEKEIEELKKNDSSNFYRIHKRVIFGTIAEAEKTISIDTDEGILYIDKQECVLKYVPQVGDKVVLDCQVQEDESFLDKQGEIIAVKELSPLRIFKQEMRRIVRLNSDWGELNYKSFFFYDILENGYVPQIDDIVITDLVECERDNFDRRAIRMLPKQVGVNETITPAAKENDKSFHQVSISDSLECRFDRLFQKKTLDVKLTNNRDRALTVMNVIIGGRRSSSQIRLDDENLRCGFDLAPNEERILKFNVDAKIPGRCTETFVINFGNFSVKRQIKIVVPEIEADIAMLNNQKENNINNSNNLKDFDAEKTFLLNRQNYQKNRVYSNKIWNAERTSLQGPRPTRSCRFALKCIKSYDVPAKLKRAYLINDSQKNMFENLENLYPCLSENLNFKNYVDRFDALIHLEEIECFVSFRRFDRDRAHFAREGEYLALEVENLAEARPSLVIGDTVRAINPWSENENDQNCFNGIIHKVLNNRVLIKYHEAFQSKYNGEDYRLEFYFSRFGYRKQHFAVQKAVDYLGEDFLFPRKCVLREKPQIEAQLDKEDNLIIEGVKKDWFNSSLNKVQKQAVCNILKGESYKMPYIIFGPPGTGKTVTVVETILQLAKNISHARILVATPSNSAADLIAIRLIESKVVKPGDFIRLVSQNFMEKDLVPKILCPYSGTIDIGDDNSDKPMIITESGLKLKCQRKYIGCHRIIISTCSTLGNFHLVKFPLDHFTHIIVDEAAQCIEPEIMLPITKVSPKGGQVILAGDPLQLQAVVTNRYAVTKGSAYSFLERLLQTAPYSKKISSHPDNCGYDPRLVTKLIYNYRSLPSVLKLYDDLFYDSELIAKVEENESKEINILRNIREALPGVPEASDFHGVFFYGLLSNNQQGNDSPSWFNPLEAKYVFITVVKMYQKGIGPKQIGIVTPYIKQVKHIRLLFEGADIPCPKIGTVEEFQGQERDIIIISTVRSQVNLVGRDLRFTLGFLQNPKRVNVAISRARCLNLIVGNPHLLAKDSCWKAVIKYCVDNNAYTGCELPENF